MHFSRVVSFFFVLFAFAFVAFGKPFEKRQETDITGPLETALTEIAAILSQAQANPSLGPTLAPEITAALAELESALSGLTAADLRKRDIVQDVAVLLGEIITDIVTFIDITGIPIVNELIIDIDVTLNGLVATINGLLGGLIPILDQVLAGVAGLLEGVGLQLVAFLLAL